MKLTIQRTITTLAALTTFVTAALAQPTLGSITPNQGPRGTTVTISGTQFDRNVNGYYGRGRNWGLYYWNGSAYRALNYTYVNSTRLTATIPGDFSTSNIKLQGYYYDRLHNYTSYIRYTSNKFTVTNQQTAMKFTNSTQYALVELKLNGQRLFNVGQAILAGNNATFNVAAGTYQLDATLGTVNNNTINAWFTDHATVTILNGQVNNIEWTRITLGELFGGFVPNQWKRFNGYYFDANANYHTATLWINNNNSFQLYNDGRFSSGGSLVETSWPNYSSIVNFRLGSNGPISYSNFPFATIYSKCGPASWSWIEFTKQ